MNLIITLDSSGSSSDPRSAGLCVGDATAAVAAAELHAQLVECMPHSVAAGDRYPDVEVLGGEELLMELPA
eukprot:CAMPEP_0171279516 /NCGR_PEP_ID=MMETSP0790-20130122/65426_1 /TAXON_ID=2925 /ORGANISM="Alexandrium catenella, Strain OF101" /LENGTH=70 /DNA_ID=CAMNT_0011748709 /DNA_START=341 /DNA_END=549 /DNA_ORIENTATION=+